MYQIYEKRIRSDFAGTGTETLIAKDGAILAHLRAWDDAAVTDDDFVPALKGQPIHQAGQGWRKLAGEEAENAQAWAEGLV